MTFEDWFTKQVGVAPVHGSFVELAWNAAIDAAVHEACYCFDNPVDFIVSLDVLKTPLNIPTSPEQGQAKGVGASRF